MVNLNYMAICSLDGYVADAEGNFDWAAPDEEVHAFVNDLERDVGTYLFGRRMYETMSVWESMEGFDSSPVTDDYGRIWRGADKIVYSTTLPAPMTARTRLERTFDPDAVRAMKMSAAQDISIGGPTLAAQAMSAGLVDECQLFLCPISIGGGLRALPATVRLDLHLLAEKTFDSGMIYLRYRLG